MDKISKKEARAIRNSPLSDLIAAKLMTDESIGNALKNAIDQKLKSHAIGVKEKFNILFIAKVLTGGKIPAEILAKMLGVDLDEEKKRTRKKKVAEVPSVTPTPDLQPPSEEKDPKKATKVKEEAQETQKVQKALVTKVSSSRRQKVRRGDSVSDVITKLYSLIEKNIEDNKLQLELNKDFHEQKKIDEARRHDELIKAINEFMGKKGSGTLSKENIKALHEKLSDHQNFLLKMFEERALESVSKRVGQWLVSTVGPFLLQKLAGFAAELGLAGAAAITGAVAMTAGTFLAVDQLMKKASRDSLAANKNLEQFGIKTNYDKGGQRVKSYTIGGIEYENAPGAIPQEYLDIIDVYGAANTGGMNEGAAFVKEAKKRINERLKQDGNFYENFAEAEKQRRSAPASRSEQWDLDNENQYRQEKGLGVLTIEDYRKKYGTPRPEPVPDQASGTATPVPAKTPDDLPEVTVSASRVTKAPKTMAPADSTGFRIPFKPEAMTLQFDQPSFGVGQFINNKSKENDSLFSTGETMSFGQPVISNQTNVSGSSEQIYEPIPAKPHNDETTRKRSLVSGIRPL